MQQTRSNRLEVSPERPERGNDTRRELAGIRETTNRTVLRDINHRNTEIPWKLVEEADGPKLSFSDFDKAALWGRMGMYWQLSRGKNDSYGAQFHAERIQKLSDYQKADIIEQIERLDQGKMSWRTKLVSSLMKSHAENELFKKGYVRREGVGPATGSHEVRSGETLETIMKDRPGGEALWQKIKSGAVLGPLDSADTLPPGTHVYFNAEGYPVYISSRSGERPTVPIFEKKDAEAETKIPAGWKWGAEAYRRLEFIQKRMKVGDVLFTNARRDLYPAFRRMFYGAARMLQGKEQGDESFPYIHTLVVVGIEKRGVTVAHLAGDKARTPLLHDLVNSEMIDSLSIGRIADRSKAAGFAKSATDVAVSSKYATNKELLEYRRTLAKKRTKGAGNITAQEEKRLKDICVCTKVVSQAGALAGVDELKNTDTAFDQFKNVTIVDTMNLQPITGRRVRTKPIKVSPKRALAAARNPSAN